MMEEGKRYYYLSVPNESEWTEITLHRPTKYERKHNWSLCFSVEENDLYGFHNLMHCIDEIKDYVKAYYEITDSKDWIPTANEDVYWVYVTTQSDIRKIKIQNKKGVNFYQCNGFKTKTEAEGLRIVIRTVLHKYGIVTENGN